MNKQQTTTSRLNDVQGLEYYASTRSTTTRNALYNLLLPHNLLPSGQYNTPIVSLTET
jgi:hypothetical protein